MYVYMKLNPLNLLLFILSQHFINFLGFNTTQPQQHFYHFEWINMDPGGS